MSALLWLACTSGGFGGGHYAPGDSAWLLLQTGVDPVNDDLWILDLGTQEAQDTAGSVDSGPTPFFPALFRVHGESHSSRRVLDLYPDGCGWVSASVDFIQGGVVVSDYLLGGRPVEDASAVCAAIPSTLPPDVLELDRWHTHEVDRITGQSWTLNHQLAAWHQALNSLEPAMTNPADKTQVLGLIELMNVYFEQQAC